MTTYSTYDILVDENDELKNKVDQLQLEVDEKSRELNWYANEYTYLRDVVEGFDEATSDVEATEEYIRQITEEKDSVKKEYNNLYLQYRDCMLENNKHRKEMLYEALNEQEELHDSQMDVAENEIHRLHHIVGYLEEKLFERVDNEVEV